MGKPKKKSKKKGAAKQRPIALISIGEGPERGKVYRAAKRLAERGVQERIIVVDPKPAEYEPPNGMVYIRQDGSKFLAGIRPCSTKKIYDKYAFSLIAFGKHAELDKYEKFKREQVLVRLERAGADVRTDGIKVPLIEANMRRYARNAFRALIPGGKFVILTGDKTHKPKVLKALTSVGFEVRKVHELSVDEIARSGSGQAVHDQRRGTKVFRIHAIKPKEKH